MHALGELQELGAVLLCLAHAAIREQVLAGVKTRSELRAVLQLGRNPPELAVRAGVGEVRHAVRTHALGEGKTLLCLR
jgi:hypothetical protein